MSAEVVYAQLRSAFRYMLVMGACQELSAALQPQHKSGCPQVSHADCKPISTQRVCHSMCSGNTWGCVMCKNDLGRQHLSLCVVMHYMVFAEARPRQCAAHYQQQFTLCQATVNL